MTRILTLATLAGLAALGACRSSEPPAAYANPVEACEHKATTAERDECMKNVVADVAISVKREAERKTPR